MVWNGIFCVNKSHINLPSHSPSDHQLSALFDYKCREWSIWAAISFLVRFTVALKCMHFPIQIQRCIFFSRFPFNWKNPIGYIFVVIFEYIISTYAYVVVFGAVFFGIGCCVFVVAIITKNIKNDLKFINENATSDPNQLITFKLIKSFIQNHSILEKFSAFPASSFMPFKTYKFRFYFQVYPWLFELISNTVCDFIYMEPGHNMQCFTTDSNGNSLVIQTHRLPSLNWFANIFFTFSLSQQQDRDSMVLLVIGFYVSYAFGLVLAICECGQRLSDAFEGIHNDFALFDWHSFPHKIQRTLPIILMTAQQPVRIKCFGSISAVRENSKTVNFYLSKNLLSHFWLCGFFLSLQIINGAFSYFMAMRQFIKWRKWRGRCQSV